MGNGDRVQIALQLYTVRDETGRDFAGTVRQVAAIGYRAVEFAGYGGLTPEQMAALLRVTGLTAAATHVSLEALERDLPHQLEYCQAIGCTYLVLPGVPEDQRGGDDLHRLADRFNQIGRRCANQGIHFAYHNHDHEFALHGGRTHIETMLAETDAEIVSFELDVYWAAHAGTDPAIFLRRYTARIPLLHFKDRAKDGGFAEVGDGDLNLAALYTLAAELEVRWCIVENDAPSLPSLESARRSWQNLQAMRAAT